MKKIALITSLLASVSFANEASALTLVTGPASINKPFSVSSRTLNCVAQNLTNKSQKVSFAVIDAQGNPVRTNDDVLAPKMTLTWISPSDLLPATANPRFYCSFNVSNNKVRAYLQVEDENGLTLVNEEAHK